MTNVFKIKRYWIVTFCMVLSSLASFAQDYDGCVNEEIKISFETTSTGLTYQWSTINSSNVTINSTTNATGLYTFTPILSGLYTIHLKTYEADECTFEFDKSIVVENCTPFVSCTKTNENSPVIKSIFTTLANKLLNLPAGTVIDGYKCPELTALEYYVKDENPAIYNFVHNIQEGFVAFSFADHQDYDVKIATNGNTIADFNLDDYESNEIVTELSTTPSSTVVSYVNHINFCSGLYCISHVAIVVDESGSIDGTEAIKIKKQLKKFIQQQANDNDILKSNIYISLTGMSDGDINTRTDKVEAIKVTNDPIVLNKFNTWIDKYGTRNGNPGVSASSDYWKSGLDAALQSEIKPNIVIMITDGCETGNVIGLKDQTMSRFSNSKSTLDSSPSKPHLYVVGIENGFYVNSDNLASNTFVANQEQSLLNENTESSVAPLLTTSLKFLLDFPETEFPKSSIDDFGGGDYFGHDSFDFLGTVENETYFSDKLSLSHFVCGRPTVRDSCADCYSFQPEPGKEYVLSAWVKEESFVQVKTYENAIINVIFYNDKKAEDIYRISTLNLAASGDIIDGWQRIVSKFTVPANTITIGIELENKSSGIPAYYDDIRIHPIQGSLKTFVYDPETFKLMSELDENNYSTFYEYDNEGGLVRIKKETAKGVKTIQETRSGTIINAQD